MTNWEIQRWNGGQISNITQFETDLKEIILIPAETETAEKRSN